MRASIIRLPVFCTLWLSSTCGWFQQSMGLDHRLAVHRLSASEDAALNVGAAVLEIRVRDLEALAEAYRTASEQANMRFQRSANLALVTAGPVLDSPDSVAVGSFSRTGSKIELHVIYTSARLRGEPLRRNVPWQPLLEIPMPSDLAPGSYSAGVTWEAVETLPDRKPLGTTQRVDVSFSID